jgi:hypothetical protein
MYIAAHADVSREQLGELGVKAGHQVKILKKVREEFDKQLNAKKEEPAELPQQSSIKVEFGYGEGDVHSYDQPEDPQLPAIEDNPHPLAE